MTVLTLNFVLLQMEVIFPRNGDALAVPFFQFLQLRPHLIVEVIGHVGMDIDQDGIPPQFPDVPLNLAQNFLANGGTGLEESPALAVETPLAEDSSQALPGAL